MKTATMNKKMVQATIEPGKAETLSIDKIEFSPLNYRKYFRQEDLETFAEELKLHGIISPLTVRKLPNDKYQLVAGERRLRAAKIAKLQTVPVIVRDLTDEQVTEIQLAENLQRENPHPLDEANAVKLMQDTGKNIDEISMRLGKSKQFVYIRLKLLNLIEPIRETFFGEVINLQQALTIATISQEGQTQFFNEHCTKWKQKGFQLPNLDYYLRPYKYDLRNAPFDTKDKKLIPEVGACTGCPFNSATLKSLFPDYAKQAICTNTACYGNKCTASLRLGFVNGLHEHQPVALLFNGEPSEKMVELLKSIEAAEIMPRHDYNQITILEIPEEPQEEDFMYDDDDEGEKLNRKELYTATQNYKEELKEYDKFIKSGKYQKGLLEKNGDFYHVWFNLDKPQRNDYGRGGNTVTMKVVQEAIKAGTATVELLDTAIEGIKHRETRAKEIDRDKVQVSVLQQVEEKTNDFANIRGLTEADKVAARLLVYQSLDYSSRNQVDQTLFKKVKEVNFEVLKKLTDKEYSYLIRMALMGKSDSKYPTSVTGITLYKVAGNAGVDLKKIEADQQSKAAERAERVKGRVSDLQKRKVKLKKEK
jgi:ParB family chromosome partitioning protein